MSRGAHGRACVGGLSLACLCAASWAASTVAGASTAAGTPTFVAASADPFDRAFPTAGEPRAIHYTARYDDRRGTHLLEVWRQGDVRLRRRTDEAIDLYAERDASSAAHGGLQLDVLDHRRRIATQVSRDALDRIGHGVEWFALAHGLARPRGAFSVLAWQGALPSAAAGDCRWVRLHETTRDSAVCWNAQLHLPACIVDLGTGRTVWTLVSADTAPIAPAVFAVHAPGYVRVDADRDMRAD